MSMPMPTKCRFGYFKVDGYDIVNHLNRIKVFETIKKSYLTGQATLLDNNNVIENMGFQGGEKIEFLIDAGDGREYAQTLYLLSIKGEKTNESLRTMRYQMELIGKDYFDDKKSLVQQSFKHIPGTQAIQALHGQYLGGALEVLAQSLGPISLQSYIVSSKKPITAIKEIMGRLNYGQYQSGNTLYFRDAQKHVLGPLEALFDRLSAQEYFIQEATWGKNWFDVVRAQNGIIACTADVEENANGRTGMKDVASVATQEKKVFDFRFKDIVVDKMASKIGAGKVIGQAMNILSPIIQGAKHGGAPNYSTMDSSHLPKDVDPSVKSEAERLYAALVKNGPQLTVKVPIQSGINCTVGKGAHLKLIPPAGDLNLEFSQMSGLYLITELCHDAYADTRMVNATTTFRAARGGIG